MNELNLTELLKKYEAGTLTAEEHNYLEQWYIEYAKHSSEQIDEGELNHIYNRLQNELFSANKTIIKHIWSRVAVAASVILIVGLSGYWWLQKEKTKPAVIKQNQEIVQDIKPGGNKAILTLADGSKIAISDASGGTLAHQGNSVIQKNGNGSIAYTGKAGDNSNMVNTLSTPAGGETGIVLADGTEVKLDAASSITYPVAFSGNERRVTVTGQAYFKVKHNASKPFIVVAGGQTIRDIGTEFNVNTYNDTKTTLVEGRINVNGKALIPGQQAVSGNNTVEIKKVDVDETVSWTDGFFRFNNENIHSIMDEISKWYDIDVTYEPGVTTEGLTGTISRYKNISQVFYMLSYGQNVHFKIDGRRVTVMQ